MPTGFHAGEKVFQHANIVVQALLYLANQSREDGRTNEENSLDKKNLLCVCWISNPQSRISIRFKMLTFLAFIKEHYGIELTSTQCTTALDRLGGDRSKERLFLRILESQHEQGRGPKNFEYSLRFPPEVTSRDEGYISEWLAHTWNQKRIERGMGPIDVSIPPVPPID